MIQCTEKSTLWDSGSIRIMHVINNKTMFCSVINKIKKTQNKLHTKVFSFMRMGQVQLTLVMIIYIIIIDTFCLTPKTILHKICTVIRDHMCVQPSSLPSTSTLCSGLGFPGCRCLSLTYCMRKNTYCLPSL